MKYLCLVYLDEEWLNELPDEDCVAYDGAISKSRHCLASETLESVHTAATVRVRGSTLLVADGSFAETKEQLGGYHLIECKDLGQAISIAKRTPTLPYGGVVEVRPLRRIQTH